ncbi:exosortase X [Hymenobacter armeniacus]|uniref:Archaeosortase/exosortase family protein n=1 Tax=Hymenobacter armeniacus TaxID=2771358 RepID=A0ABR8JYE5_9BACT|nr:archaeosortase/exosortase family protein [Hymenobacter armeniacus]MBD2724422.1 archaeosortase/exosortase family protein [Hymenobacter armeniacus]
MLPSAPAAGAPPDNRLLFRFLLVAAAMYLAWFFGYQQWLGPDGRLDAALCAQITRSSVGLLQGLGFEASVSPTYDQLVLMSGRPSVVVYPPCNGLVLYALFGGFVLAFPGPWRRKAWFIPAGMALIWGLNVLRVAALAINHRYAHSSLEFNHHYTFNFVVYGCIFGLWMLWARRLAVAPNAPAHD